MPGSSGKPARRSLEESTAPASSAGFTSPVSHDNRTRVSGHAHLNKPMVHWPGPPQLTPFFSGDSGGVASSSMGNLELQRQFAADKGKAHLQVAEERHRLELLHSDQKHLTQHQRWHAAEVQGAARSGPPEGAGGESQICRNGDGQQENFQQQHQPDSARLIEGAESCFEQKELHDGATSKPAAHCSRYVAARTQAHRVGEWHRDLHASPEQAVSPQCSRSRQSGKQPAVGGQPSPQAR